jgi:phenylacetate-CoA ligase
MNLRNIVFKLADFFKGSPIGRSLNDIEKILINPISLRNRELQNNRLIKMLTHASMHVKFYKERVQSQSKIEDFPIIDKLIIKERIDDFISDGKKKEDLFRVVTSGSTGTPFTVYHDHAKRRRNTADAIYFGQLAGFQLGWKLVYLKIWNKINTKNTWAAWSQNIKPIDVTHLSDTDLKKIASYLQQNKTKKVLLGYASALETLAMYLDKYYKDGFIENVSAIIAMSEAMNSTTNQLLQRYFKVIPVSRYSNVENGIIAQQLPNGQSEFVINWASYFVEVLEFENGKHAQLGAIGRIVITDLFNFAMPIIRYDTGDTGILDWSKDGSKLVLRSVEGRRMDLVFDSQGNIVSSFTITNNMWGYPEIKQYQFIQFGSREYKFVLNVPLPFLREHELVSEFKKYFGIDSSILIDYVNEIPLLKSGKRKKVVNLWTKYVRADQVRN